VAQLAAEDFKSPLGWTPKMVGTVTYSPVFRTSNIQLLPRMTVRSYNGRSVQLCANMRILASPLRLRLRPEEGNTCFDASRSFHGQLGFLSEMCAALLRDGIDWALHGYTSCPVFSSALWKPR
jgi:hypothetical protein